MSRKYPRVSFHVVSATPATLFSELRARNLDLIIWLTFDSATDEDIDSEILYEDRMVVVAATNNPWTRRRRVELADLVNEPWAMAEPNAFLAKALAEAFRVKGIEPPRATVTGASGHTALIPLAKATVRVTTSS